MNLFLRTTMTASIATLALAAAPARAQDSYIQINTGVDYSSGDYGDVEDTDYLSVPVGIKYQADRFYVKASISYVHAEGPSGIIPVKAEEQRARRAVR